MKAPNMFIHVAIKSYTSRDIREWTIRQMVPNNREGIGNHPCSEVLIWELAPGKTHSQSLMQVIVKIQLKDDQ